MKAICYLLLLCGCAAKPPARGGAAVPASRKPMAPVQMSPPAGGTPAFPVIILPPFIYRVPLTNCWLESSTDLAHWEARNDFTVTNGQWLVKMDPSKPREFYRAGGETVP
jgi:hypothetical protein